MRIAIVGVSFTSSHTPLMRAFLDEMILAGDMLFAGKEIRKKLISELSTGGQINALESSDTAVDLFLSIGGDGTLLNSISDIKNSCIPVLGINTGRLGYLTSATLSDAALAVKKIRENNFLIDKRSLLRVETKGDLFGETNYGLNDFTIYKNDSASMINIRAYINGVFLNSYWGDGLIISTPTGSTAYSLSCGGPIISGECGVFAVTPIAPHNLNVRPLILPDNTVLKLTAETRQQWYIATLDSRSIHVESDIEFTIIKEDFYINLVHFPDQNFPARIRSKLHWGLDQRN
jgi:NAD+ kinase